MPDDCSEFVVSRCIAVEDGYIPDEVVASTPVGLSLREILIGRISLLDGNPGGAVPDVRPAGAVHPLGIQKINQGCNRYPSRTHHRSPDDDQTVLFLVADHPDRLPLHGEGPGDRVELPGQVGLWVHEPHDVGLGEDHER